MPGLAPQLHVVLVGVVREPILWARVWPVAQPHWLNQGYWISMKRVRQGKSLQTHTPERPQKNHCVCFFSLPNRETIQIVLPSFTTRALIHPTATPSSYTLIQVSMFLSSYPNPSLNFESNANPSGRSLAPSSRGSEAGHLPQDCSILV